MPRQLEASVDEMLEVFRLAEEGESVRGIAARVFGDRRLRGRVERLLAARRRGVALRDPGALDDLVRDMLG